MRGIPVNGRCTLEVVMQKGCPATRSFIACMLNGLGACPVRPAFWHPGVIAAQALRPLCNPLGGATQWSSTSRLHGMPDTDDEMSRGTGCRSLPYRPVTRRT